MQLDRDGDGKVSREEAPEPMRPFFDRLDENKDGFIDAAEVAKMRSLMGRGGRPGGGPSGGGPPGGGPPGGRSGEGPP